MDQCAVGESPLGITEDETHYYTLFRADLLELPAFQGACNVHVYAHSLCPSM